MTALLYAITPDGLTDQCLVDKVNAVLRGGCQWIQYRDKSVDTERRERQARALKNLCATYGAKLIINDDLDLAIAIDADGVHLGQGDGDHARVREALGPTKIFGITCHDSITLAQDAIDKGASYLAFGRFFPSKTKPDAKPAPLSLIKQARQHFENKHICVIGGIDQSRVAMLLSEGADVIAVSEALFLSENPEQTTREFLTLITQFHSSSTDQTGKDFS